MNMITAKEARDMSGPTPEYYLNIIMDKVKGEAKKGKHEVLIGEVPFNGWLYNGRAKGVAGIVVNELRDLGYSVSQYSDGSYFGGFALKINWS